MEGKTIFSEMWQAYRGTILRSIVTSFGLDFLVHDQLGGDVDTIHNIRADHQYKDSKNAEAYENRGVYDSTTYHHNDVYDNTIRAARNSQEFIDDAYVPGNRVFYGKASSLSKADADGNNHRANLDHVISAKEIHDDPGRVLAGLDGVELANDPNNLRFTNEHLNKSMGSKTIDEYIEWRDEHGNPLPEDVQSKMKEEDLTAREAYERSIADAYYSSDRFLMDAGIAAANRGLEMGARQVLGFLFIEIWFACEEEMKALPSGVHFSDCIQAIAKGIQKGVDISGNKYKELFSQFFQGFTAGALASISTTLINVFITTDKNTIRYIRQGYVIVVQVGNILLINPDDLLLGEQIKAATVSLATGASVMAGTAVGNQIAKLPILQENRLGYIVQNFCSSLVSGLISCTLLIMIDRSQYINDLVKKLNHYGPLEHEIQEVSNAFIQLSAELAAYDIDAFSAEVKSFNNITERILIAHENDLHNILADAFDALNIPLPWEGDFDKFMSNPDNCLVFE